MTPTMSAPALRQVPNPTTAHGYTKASGEKVVSVLHVDAPLEVIDQFGTRMTIVAWAVCDKGYVWPLVCTQRSPQPQLRRMDVEAA